MATLNETLTDADFTKILTPDEQKGFRPDPKARVELLPAGFELYKISIARPRGADDMRISSWWTTFRPYKEDYEGALGRYTQAEMNGIDMSAMARYMAAVRVDWNDMSDYLQIKLKRPAKAFWGMFSGQPLYSPNLQNATPEDRARFAAAIKGAALPDDIGALDAWQLFIPNLKQGDVEEIATVNAHNMAALGPAIRFAAGHA